MVENIFQIASIHQKNRYKTLGWSSHQGKLCTEPGAEYGGDHEANVLVKITDSSPFPTRPCVTTSSPFS